MRNPNPYEDGVDVRWLMKGNGMTLTPERIAQINKMSMEEFSQLSAREQRAYAKVPLPPERVRAIMLGLSGKSHLSVAKDPASAA
jgi:hypothetical protein